MKKQEENKEEINYDKIVEKNGLKIVYNPVAPPIIVGDEKKDEKIENSRK